MKTKIQILVALVILGCSFFAHADSKTYSWVATQYSDHHVVTKTHLSGPMRQGKPPEKAGAFKGSFRVMDGVQVDLEKIRKVSIDEDGELLTSNVGFAVLSKSSVKDKKATQVEIQTDALAFEHGDALILIFRTGDRFEMVYARIVLSFSPD